MTHPTVTLNTGASMPMLGFGTWQLDDPTAERAVASALEAGYRSIDTSAAYGNERGVGRAIRDSGIARPEIFLTTKVVDREGYDHTIASAHASLERLGVDHVDLFLIHWPFDESMAETWRAMQDLHADGLAAAIGVSNFGIERLNRLLAAATIVPAVNQVELHPRLAQTALRDYCSDRGIVVEAWSPLMQGGELLSHPSITAIAAAHDRSPAQVILRWHLQHGLVAIPRSTSPQHVRTNAALHDFVLSAADLAIIDALDAGRRANPNADPDTYVFTDEVYAHLQSVND
ncbi:aldo/keto reductase [Nocardia heshunensis]